MTFPADRAAALAALAAFLPRAGRHYASHRNFDEGPGARRHVSELSPAIRRRLITEAEVARAAVALHGFGAAETFVQEVCWRSYWRGWLEGRPTVWRDYLRDLAALELELERDAALAGAHAQAVAGNTGIDAFDAWARELVETGYLHNHARMSFASIWIFTQRLPWQLGAAFFYRHLLDACPASNTLSWRWVAGLQTPGKTYRAQAEIIRKTSLGRFRVDTPLAEDAPAPAPGQAIAPTGFGPFPEADPGARSGLFVHTEDLAVEQIGWPAAIRALAGPTGIDGDPADRKRAYADACLEDGLARAGRHFGLEPDRLPVEDLPRAMTAWARANGLEQVLTAHAPVGPVADRLALMGRALAAAGIRMVPILRPWDAAAWPHAQRGFFQFRKHIPALLA